LSGCAARPVEFVPAGVYRQELAGAIFRQGQSGSSESGYQPGQPPPLTRLDKGFQVALQTTGYALAIAVVAPLYVAYALAKHGY
jgi:hypothetical protein